VRWTIPGLDARETAFAVWVVLILGFVAVKSGGFRSSAWSLFKIVFGSILAVFIVAAAAYMTLTVGLLKVVGFWDCPMAKATVLWFVGTGLVTAFSTKRKDGAFFVRLVMRNVSLAAVLAYLMNIHPFPLYVWLPLVPVIFLFAGVKGLADADPEFASAGTVSDVVLSVIGLTALAFSFNYVVGHFEKLTTGETGKRFVLPLVLTVCFIPFLYALALVIVYQGMLGMILFRSDENEQVYRFARRKIIRACGLSLGRAQLFDEQFRGKLWSGMDEEEVVRVLDEFREAWEAQPSRRTADS